MLPFVWVARGQRSTEWMWRLCEAIRLQPRVVRRGTGQSCWSLLPTACVAVMQVALAVFARDEGIDAQYRIVLTVNGAGWHTGTDLLVPDGIDLVRLPPASPKLPPVEPITNRTFGLDESLVRRYQTLRADRVTFRRQTCFQQWWPFDIAPAVVQQ